MATAAFVNNSEVVPPTLEPNNNLNKDKQPKTYEEIFKSLKPIQKNGVRIRNEFKRVSNKMPKILSKVKNYQAKFNKSTTSKHKNQYNSYISQMLKKINSKLTVQ